MGNETILYYVFEETVTGRKRIVKPHFWRKIKPLTFVLEEDDLSVITIMIPTLEKGWKRDKLLGVMQEGIEACREYRGYIGNDRTVINNELQQILSYEDDFSPVYWELTNMLFADKFIAPKRMPEVVVLLLGNTVFPEEQMEKFTEMMQPCFPYINRLTVVYGIEDNDTNYGVNNEENYEINPESADESGYAANENRNRIETAIDDLLEMLYYEYGLVGRIWKVDGYKPQPPGIRNGQCPILFLDYGYEGKLPYSMMRNGGTYIDVFSSGEKKRRINNKCSKISYLSPLKYLDTMVKSGYDKLVN
ncbi:MAG: hypothetical protein J1E98_13495 [Lachnospiraceae bacterium]|nr:hypothetical protein [Lachnospiraceae bacterium]